MKFLKLKAKGLLFATCLVLMAGCGQAEGNGSTVTSPIIIEETNLKPSESLEAESTEASSEESQTDSTESTEASSEVSTESAYLGDLDLPNISPTVFEGLESQKQDSIRLLAVGDNLMHMGLIGTGKQSDGTYNYDFLFRNMTEVLDLADIKVINQETILGGDYLGFSGYPAFNSPTAVGDSVAKAGFNVVLQASNHTLDKGLEGLKNCLQFWESHPNVLVAGIGEDNTGKIPLMTIGDYTFAILNYTYGTNMEKFPSYAEGYMNILCKYGEDRVLDFTRLNPQVLEDIKAAKEIADIVIVFPHWGVEYTTTPTRYEKEFALAMTEAGADLIIGTHPHVIQPVEWITADNGNVSLCYYSLGNYASTQMKPICMLEGMAWVTFDVTEDGLAINATESGVLPLVAHYNCPPLRFDTVYFLENYTAEQAAAHGIKNYGKQTLHYDELVQWSNEVFGDYQMTLEEALNPGK